METDRQGLQLISGGTGSSADVIFVHELGGGSHSTWNDDGSSDSVDHFWPEALGKALPQCRVWSFGYAAGITRLGDPGMIIEKRTGNMADQLLAVPVAPSTAKIGARP